MNNAHFRNEHILRYLDDLNALIHDDSVRLDLNYKTGYFSSPAEARKDTSSSRVFREHERWGGRNSYSWFFTDIVIPDSFRGKELSIVLSTSETEEMDNAILARSVGKKQESWDLMNPQALVFLNGNMLGGADKNHTEIILPPLEKNSISLDFQCFSGLTEKYYTFNVELAEVNIDIRALYFDILTAYEAAAILSDDSLEKHQILSELNNSLNLLDLRSGDRQRLLSSVQRARKHLAEKVYTGTTSKVSVSCVGHAHIDVAWLWDLAQTREKAKRTFSSVLSMMKMYPDYNFMQSTPLLYKFIKEDAPELYEEIKERIREGRWDAEGAMFLEADCNITSGESLVRQILYGKRFFREEFGIDSHILWLPDVFGYSAALPQILVKSGINTFMTTKISWNMINKMPFDTFMWQGIGEESVLTYFITAQNPGDDPDSIGTTYSAELHPAALYKSWQRYQQKDINSNILIAFGFGDGGGGPTYEMLEKGKRLEKGIPGFPEVKFDTTKNFFSDLHKTLDNSRDLPRWRGELYLELHQGTYTSNAAIKRNNRKTEIAFHSAEFWLAAANILRNAPYPHERLRNMWEILLLNQFHDILPGSCIEDVYKDSEKQFNELAAELCTTTEKAISESIGYKEEKGTVTVINELGFRRSGILSLSSDPLPEYLIDSEGLHYAVQKGEDGKGEVYVRDIPAFGWKTFRFSSTPLKATCMKSSTGILENERIRVSFDKNGLISSIYHKLIDEEFVRDGEKAGAIAAYDDRPRFWENWNIDPYYEEKSWLLEDLVSPAEYFHGEVYDWVRTVRKFNKSMIYQTIRVYHDSDLIEFITDVDWNEDSVALKAVFPTTINSDRARYDIQFGSVERPTHYNTSWDMARYEVCAQKWMDLSEGNMGLSILNESKYGCDVHEGTMRLTLLKSGLSPWKEIDRGHHHFSYAIYPHAGDSFAADTKFLAESFNLPLRAVRYKAEPTTWSMLSVDNPSVIIDTVKMAEDSDDIIVRIYEHKNSHVHTTLKTAFRIREAYETDLLENCTEKLDKEDDLITLDFHPFEIKTIRITPEKEEK